MKYLKDSIYYKSFSHVLKIVLTVFHGQANVEHGVSLNEQLVNENMRESSLISQRFVKDHMLLNDYILISSLLESWYEMLGTRTLLTKSHWGKKESENKAEKDQRLASIEEEISLV